MQEILSGLRIFGFVGLGPKTSITVFLTGSPRRFADFRVRRTGPEKFVWQKSYAVWQLSDRPVKFSGRLMTEPEKFF